MNPSSGAPAKMTSGEPDDLKDIESGIFERKLGDKLLYAGRERMRKLALQTLAGLLVVILVIACITMALGRWDEAREFLEITFVPLVGLLGTAIAYYYTGK